MFTVSAPSTNQRKRVSMFYTDNVTYDVYTNAIKNKHSDINWTLTSVALVTPYPRRWVEE